MPADRPDANGLGLDARHDDFDVDTFDRDFKPRGTVAVVVAFTAALFLLWLAVYLILLARGVTV